MEKLKDIRIKYIVYLCILCIVEISLFFVFAYKGEAKSNEKESGDINNTINSQNNYENNANKDNVNSTDYIGGTNMNSLYKNDIYDDTNEEDNYNVSRRIEDLQKSIYYGVTSKEMYSEYSDYYVKSGEKVDDDYFTDAIFIGDLRMVSFEKKSSIPYGHFFTDVNMSTKAFNEKRIYDSLSSNYKKVYIQLGYNDIATISIDDFKKEYKEMIDNIKKVCPDACIYAQSIIYVNYDKSSSNRIYCNENIDAFNNAMLSCIKEKSEEYSDIAYQDVNSLVCDDNGALQDRLSDDGVNLNDFCCKALYIYLKTYLQ